MNILLVEDSEDDRFLTVRVLSKAGLDTVQHVEDGRMALAYLNGDGEYADRSRHPKPDVVLLDLKIPEFSGHEVLEWINTQPELQDCPVFILSSSGEARDRDRAAAANAAGYFVKPLMAENVAEILAVLKPQC